MAFDDPDLKLSVNLAIMIAATFAAAYFQDGNGYAQWFLIGIGVVGAIGFMLIHAVTVLEIMFTVLEWWTQVQERSTVFFVITIAMAFYFSMVLVMRAIEHLLR